MVLIVLTLPAMYLQRLVYICLTLLETNRRSFSCCVFGF